MTQDYSVTLQDGEGHTVTIYITGASIDEAVSGGIALYEAVENVESSAGWKAINEGYISKECWEVSRTFNPIN